MKHLIFLLSLLFITVPATAAFAAPPAAVEDAAALPASLSSADLTREAVESKIGRKLKFKERVILSVARGKLKGAERRAAKKANGGGPTDGFAIASLVCGILGLFVGVTAIPALVFGIISLNRINRDPQYLKGKGMAIAGIVLGGIVILALLLLLLIVALFWGAF